MKKIIVLILVLLVSGCQSQTSKITPTLKEELHVALPASPPTLDPPRTASVVALNIAMNFYEPLFAQDEKFIPQPMLAKSYDVNEDNTEFIFHLREDVKFHNGKQMKAEDVASSMNYWLKNSTKAKSLVGEGLFEVLDDYTVKATFQNPANSLLIIMSARADFPAIRPKEIIAGADENGVKEHIGTGPYKFKEWKYGEYILIEKNDEYKSVEGEPSAYAGRKTPKAKYIYYHYVPESAMRISGLQSGEYDMIEDVPVEGYEVFKDDLTLTLSTELGGTLTLFLNTNTGIMANELNRKAVQNALNMQDIMQEGFTYSELYNLNHNFMNPNGKYTSDNGKELYNIADINKAREYLKTSNYQGDTLTFLVPKDYEKIYKASLVVHEQLKNIGMNVELIAVDFPTFMEMKSDLKQWDMFIAYASYQSTPQELLALNPDWAGHDDSKLQEMVKVLQTQVTIEEMRDKWGEIQDYLYHDYVSSIILGHYNECVAYKNTLNNVIRFPTAIIWNSYVKE